MRVHRVLVPGHGALHQSADTTAVVEFLGYMNQETAALSELRRPHAQTIANEASWPGRCATFYCPSSSWHEAVVEEAWTAATSRFASSNKCCQRRTSGPQRSSSSSGSSSKSAAATTAAGGGGVTACPHRIFAGSGRPGPAVVSGGRPRDRGSTAAAPGAAAAAGARTRILSLAVLVLVLLFRASEYPLGVRYSRALATAADRRRRAARAEAEEGES